MTSRARDFLRQALELPAEERELLAHTLLESVEDAEPAAAVEAAWAEELERRMADIDAGRGEGVPHDEVMARLRARYGAA